MAQPTNANIAFWNDETIDLNPQRLKKDVPVVPAIELELQTVKGKGMESLAFLALQVAKTKDKLVMMRAIASACSCLLNDATNYTGSKSNAVEITGLDAAAEANADRATVLVTNFSDSEPVTIGELLTLMEADADELGSYFGVLFLAGNKRVNTKNRTAFNEKRKNSATASIVGEAKIFVNDSIFLTDTVLEIVYAAFLSFSPIRANMTAKVVRNLDKPHMGPALSFINMFLLLVDSGMSALKIIKEAVIKHPWVRTDFPELRPELAAANEAQMTLRQATAAERSFLKAIHGNAFVPVNYSDIDNLTGVCKEILKRTTPSYANYDGGKVTAAQLAKINSHPDVATLVRVDLATE
jgi:hypothetical protein